MSMNLRADNTFVQDDGWYQAAQRYEWFLRSRKELRVVFLELGVEMCIRDRHRRGSGCSPRCASG